MGSGTRTQCVLLPFAFNTYVTSPNRIMMVMKLTPRLSQNMKQTLDAMNNGETPILNPGNNFIHFLMKRDIHCMLPSLYGTILM